MSLSAESLTRLAADTDFRIELLEKVDRLLQLLQALFRDAYLDERLALKGGTALNLFHFGLPRLSSARLGFRLSSFPQFPRNQNSIKKSNATFNI